MTMPVASGSALPLPMSMPEAAVPPAGNAQADAAMGDGETAVFSDLMALLAGQGGKQPEGEDGAGGEVPDESAPGAAPLQAAPSTPQLQAAVISTLAGWWFDANAQGAVAGKDAAADGKVAEAAPLAIATTAQQDEQADALPSDAMPEVQLNKAITSDVSTTGAQPARPMQLAVTGSETHFAPVIDTAVGASAQAASAAPSAPVQRGGRSTGDAKAKTGEAEAAAVIEVGVGQETAGDMATAPVKPVGDSAARGDQSNSAPAKDDGRDIATVAETATEKFDSFAMPDQASLTAASPAKQVATEVTRSLSGAAHAPGAAPTHQSDARPGLGKLKVLHIQLQPETLGTVTVRLDLKGDRMEMKIEAARAETADLIQRDREMLNSIIRSAGYTSDDATIVVTHADTNLAVAAASGADASNSNSGGGGSHAAGERAGGSQGREGQGRRDQPGASQAEHHGGSADRAAEEQGIYL